MPATSAAELPERRKAYTTHVTDLASSATFSSDHHPNPQNTCARTSSRVAGSLVRVAAMLRRPATRLAVGAADIDQEWEGLLCEAAPGPLVETLPPSAEAVSTPPPPPRSMVFTYSVIPPEGRNAHGTGADGGAGVAAGTGVSALSQAASSRAANLTFTGDDDDADESGDMSMATAQTAVGGIDTHGRLSMSPVSSMALATPPHGR